MGVFTESERGINMDIIEQNWDNIKEALKKEYEISSISFDTWIKPLKYYETKEDVIYIIIPSDQGMSLNYISSKFSKCFQVIVTEMFEHNYTISFILEKDINSKENVNILVLDNEVYSNTGGQSSKATPISASAKFAEEGKTTKKKNLGLIAMTYKNAYVAQVALGADMTQCISAFKEAESFDGPSLIIAYSPCVEHGFEMSNTMQEMKQAVETGYWNLFRYNPKTGLKIDSNPTFEVSKFLNLERRFKKSLEKHQDLIQEEIDACKQNYEILKLIETKNVIE